MESKRPIVCKKMTNSASLKPQMQYVQFYLPKEKVPTPTIVASDSKPSSPHSPKNNSIQTNKEKSHFKENYAQLAEEEVVSASNNLKSERPIVSKNVANIASRKPWMQYVEFCLPKKKVPTTTIIASDSKPPTPYSTRNNSIQTNKEKSHFKEKYTQLAGKETVPLSDNLKPKRPIFCKKITNSASRKPQMQYVQFYLPKKNVPTTTIITSDSKPPPPYSTRNNSIQTNKENSLFNEKYAQLAEDTESRNQAPDKTSLPQISTKNATTLEYENSVSNVKLIISNLASLQQRRIALEKQWQSDNEELKRFENNAPSREKFYMSSSSGDGNATTNPRTVEIAPLVAHVINNDKPSSSISVTLASRENVDEIERYIQTYKMKNDALAELEKCREDELRIIRKDKEDFQKFKQVELDKFNKEIAEKRKEVRREKQTFERYQKPKSSFPNRKEREEITKLKQELESAREEMKKKMAKINAETKHLRKHLAASKKENENLQKHLSASEKEKENLWKHLAASEKEKENLWKHLAASEKENENLRKCLSEKENEVLKKDNHVYVDQKSTSKAKPKGQPSVVAIKSEPKNSYNYQRNNKVEIEHDKDSTEDKVKSKFTPLKDGVFVKRTNSSKDTDELEQHVQVSLEPEVLKFHTGSHNSNYKEIRYGNCVERIYSNGDRQVFFQSGTRKLITANGHVKYEYHNGDIQEIFPDQHKVYTYSIGVVERFYPDGFRIAEFPDGRVEKHYPDGSIRITDSHGKFIARLSNGIEVTHTPDGIKSTFFLDGTVVIEFPSGDKEVRTADFLRREFPSGAMKTIYKTGYIKTQLPNGRCRVKDEKGNVLFDNVTTLQNNQVSAAYKCGHD